MAVCSRITLSKNIKLAIFGDVYGTKKQFFSALEQVKPSQDMLIGFVGNVCSNVWPDNDAAIIFDKIIELHKLGYVLFIKGSNELKHLRESRRKGFLDSRLKWIDQQPLAVSCLFPSGSNVTLVHSGIAPYHTWFNLGSDVDVCYIDELSASDRGTSLEGACGPLWHEAYDGRLGYVVSGHKPQLDGKPKYYNYSCNLNTAPHQTGKLCVQIFNEIGKERAMIIES